MRGNGRNLFWVACTNTENCLCGMSAPVSTKEEAAALWNARCDMIEHDFGAVLLNGGLWKKAGKCRYLPDVMYSYFDEDDVEHETQEGDPDGCACSCSVCGFPMLTGEMGWFNEKEGPHGGILYEPRFRYCPECGMEVMR